MFLLVDRSVFLVENNCAHQQLPVVLRRKSSVSFLPLLFIQFYKVIIFYDQIKSPGYCCSRFSSSPYR